MNGDEGCVCTTNHHHIFPREKYNQGNGEDKVEILEKSY